MTIQHNAIADADRHEDKHASTATAGTVKIANGDGTTKFDVLPYSSLSGKPVSTAYKQILFGSSVASSQQPSAVNTALQVEFGSAQTLTDVSLSSAGLITFNNSGSYVIEVFLRFGRTAATGTAIVFNRIKKNGSQILNSNSISLTDINTVIPFSTSIRLDVSGGDTFSMEIMRDGAGINQGGLIQTTPSIGGWNASPSATVVIYKFGGLV